MTQTGREPLYVVYPYDGLSIAYSPLGYLDHGSKKKEEAFIKVQDYLLSDKAQTAIEATGRRVSLNGVSEQNKEAFNSTRGIDVNRILSPITMPSADVLMNALNLWQSRFRKPSLTVYCLDFSGSMEGEGNSQLLSAMQQVLVEEYAEANLLQAADGDVDIVVTFDDDKECFQSWILSHTAQLLRIRAKTAFSSQMPQAFVLTCREIITSGYIFTVSTQWKE